MTFYIQYDQNGQENIKRTLYYVLSFLNYFRKSKSYYFFLSGPNQAWSLTLSALSTCNFDSSRS